MIELLKTDTDIEWWNEHRKYTNEYIEMYNDIIKQIIFTKAQLECFSPKKDQGDYQIEMINDIKDTLNDIMKLHKELKYKLDNL
jgi:hypothetical protein